MTRFLLGLFATGLDLASWDGPRGLGGWRTGGGFLAGPPAQGPQRRAVVHQLPEKHGGHHLGRRDGWACLLSPEELTVLFLWPNPFWSKTLWGENLMWKYL